MGFALSLKTPRLTRGWFLLAEEEQEANIGVLGMRHKRYLKQNHKVRYYNLLTSGKLNSYLADIEQQAQNLFFSVGKRLSRKRKYNRRTQINRYDVLGAKDEQHS